MMKSVFSFAFNKVLLLLQISVGFSVPMADFYPFGDGVGDSKLQRNDDGSSGEVHISVQFPFFGNYYDSLYVSLLISLDTTL